MNVNEYVSEMVKIYGKNNDRKEFFKKEGLEDIGYHLNEDKELRKGVMSIGGKEKVYNQIVNQF